MAASSSMEQLGKAFKEFTNESNKKIILTGKPGVGKTWMARMLSDRAIREHKFDIVLWVFLNREYDKTAFYETIAHQLSLISAPNDNEVEGQVKATQGNEKDNLEKKVAEELEKKRVLFILDDELNHKDSGKKFDLVKEVESLLFKSKQKLQKILITTCKTTNEDDPNTYIIEVGPLSEKRSSSLLDEIELPEDTMAQTFLKKIRPFPADIKVLAKALKHLRQSESGVKRLEIAKEEALLQEDDTYNPMQLFLNGYELLPRSVLLDWYRPGNHFLQHGKTLHYKELIVYWILEGYLGHFDCIDDAYKKGYSVLMELIDCGLLKEQSGGDVVLLDCWLPEEQSDGDATGNDSKRQRVTLDPYDLCEFVKTIPLGLANVSNDDFGRILGPNGMIKMLSKDEENKKASTLLVDANYLGREIPDDLYLSMKEVEFLAIFNPTDKSFPQSLFQMHNCHLLVLRGCEFLESINETFEIQNKPDPSVSDAVHAHDGLKMTQAPDANGHAILKPEPSSSSPMSIHEYDLQKLTFLELSGSIYLREIPDYLFRSAPNLQSLNLSFLQIDKLPSSFYNLKKLVWLILRGCSRLQMLGSLREFHNLQMLDLSGATSFSGFKDRSFVANKKLQTLNLSQSWIKKLPLLRDLEKLNYLLLRDCIQLKRLPKISALTSLKILDVSGSTNFKEFHDSSLENLKLLKLINISQTAVKKLPLHLSNPRHLCLLGCSKLTRLSFIESMKDLEILDLSDCTSLKEIKENFFEDLTNLQVLNLSGTEVKTLPSLSKLSNLRRLLLSNCTSLVELGELNSLRKLEKLDLSNSKALRELGSFRELNNLKELDLSGTQVACLPELPDSSNLCDLFLKNCTNLKQLPSSKVLLKLKTLNLSGASALEELQVDFFKDMTNLCILDLSETNIRILPSLSDLKSLSHLLLRNCQNLTDVPDLEKITSLEKLDLSGTAVKKLPEFEESSHLRCLLLKDCSNLENFSQVDILGLLTDPDNELPCKISQLTEFEVLELPKANIDTADLQEIKFPADKQRYQWSISWLAARSSGTAKFSMSMNCIPFLQLLKKNRSLQTSLSHFHLYVHPVELETRFGDKFHNELFLRDIYIRTRQLSHEEEKQGSLDIRGFDCYPEGLELVLPLASNVFLISNMFLRCLTDLGAKNIMKMEVCWIEKCENMKTVLPGDKVEGTAAMGNDTKGESEIRKNEEDNADITGHSRSLQSNSFGNLMCLYLEHCPTLSYICHSSQQLGYLEVLQIKNCIELEVLFKDESADLPKLQKLQLWELPKLEKITCKMSSLSTLNVGECPQLLDILSSTPFPEDLKVLEIRSCDKLRNVFKGSKTKLPKLCKLHLWDLPELQSIGADLPQLDHTDSKMKYTIRGCPAL